MFHVEHLVKTTFQFTGLQSRNQYLYSFFLYPVQHSNSSSLVQFCRQIIQEKHGGLFGFFQVGLKQPHYQGIHQ